ncbi:hypothetical protein RhiirA5_496202 [Rhizophagus irregularis]|uniref:Uncharacterized protein n=3 Tax=Rhizophagus irregularis TaxID=588596 RepID=A0A2I1DS02_9GLOM|nr:hypothetical protein GLOIN_2v1767769 [Rhizophagus irregularis DAOM 181602=DAOM 197198]EXX74833.1 hypothetical protein RirG_047400 [Rhizophagus irregularis DAOM 197198w]PKC13380.1 hypothetical protein RhiirA5_496202 [Rhizophagus irregularis]PKC67218.1 hypothetical protein RhiirA1_458725 [Rhizophagus irregularis]PKY12619.1 hypothetical protein RhiirB3_424315 [Rhizophagus irregularis]POG77463.1 hypothetical protein GLOIN_2v1767769 [Rhizophagus irregularis DAOM 181602=DAOM 197198]|eukprot:XP_025184329.1 hypothetical protein GLOIN_2v1767769 [Rhizophagus irregularis DAOM 181602=DAOM 197198]
MANNLPDLCLQNIFKHLNYDKALYPCTLVNKQWSYSSIPVLWSNPFIYVFEGRKPLNSLKPLIDTYLSFLPQNQQEELEIKPKFNQNSIMFNYPVYIRHIFFYFIYEGVKYWCNHCNVSNIIIKERKNQICKALIESFFIKSSKIDTFEIFESDDDDFKISDIFGSISNIQKIQKIRTLIIAKCSDISILLNLTLNVKSLKLFTLYNFDLVNSLRQFVQSQKNLTDITFSFPPKLFPTYWEIFHSSKTATSTVTFIEFIHIQFPKNISLIYHLALFTNLQYLKFRACDFGYIPNIKEDQLIQEINSNYPLAFKKLNTIIIIEDSYLNLEILKILLQFSGEELLSLELFEVKINKFNYIIKWLEVFCPNLRRLVIVDKTNDKLEIVGIHDFFRKFNNLSYVIINGEKHFVT